MDLDRTPLWIASGLRYLEEHTDAIAWTVVMFVLTFHAMCVPMIVYNMYRQSNSPKKAWRKND